MRWAYNVGTGAAAVVKQGTPSRVAWLLAVGCSVFVLGAVAFGGYVALVTGNARAFFSHQALNPFITAGFAILGALVATHRPRNPIGWIFITSALFSTLSSFVTVFNIYRFSLGQTNQTPIADFAFWLSIWSWVPPLFLPLMAAFLLFPDGRLLSRRWQPVLWAMVLGLGATVLARALHPGPTSEWSSSSNPYGLEAARPFLDQVVALSTPVIMFGFLGSLAAVVVRFRRSRGVERQQMKWLVYAAALMVLSFVLGGVGWYLLPNSRLVQELSMASTNLGTFGIAAASAVAILRYRLYDIDLIINRTLVYSALTASTVGIYILVVGFAGSLIQSDGRTLVPFLTAGLVAVLFQPLRERVQRGVNRLMYGERDDPLAVLTRLGRRLEGTLSIEHTLPAIVETVAEALRLPYVAIALRKSERGEGWETTVSYGRPAAETVAFPLSYQSQTIGQLLVARRGADEEFGDADQRLLRNIARQAGPALHAVWLTEELQRSRQQLVAAREEERRRLRRDLHDGLGPQLASQMLTIEAVERLVGQDPQQAAALLKNLKAQSKTAIEDIREVVYNLRPPALDELGLGGALQEIAMRHGKNGLRVQVTLPESLPPLPAAVEVAVYRIAQEAVTNVVRHAGARRCHISLSIMDEPARGGLSLVITDDGQGLPRTFRSGVGHHSMRERATELGGRFSLESMPDGGARVQAWLPLPETSS